MSEPIKALTGQRLLASLRAVERPAVVVDGVSRVVFANEAAAVLFGISADNLIGTPIASLCTDDGRPPAAIDLLPAPGSPQTHAAWLALPLKGARGGDLSLFMAVGMDEPILTRSVDSERWAIDGSIRHYVASTQNDRFNLRRMLQLTGGSAATAVAYERAILAVDGRVNTLICGEDGVGKRQLADAIVAAWGRKAASELSAVSVSSQLVDRNLLRELLTLASERAPASKGGRSPAEPLLILEAVERWPADCVEPLFEFLHRNPQCRIVSTSRHSHLPSAHPGSDRWGWLATRMSTVTIELPPLRNRVDELPVLIDSQLKRAVQETPGSPVRSIGDNALRMMLTYRWPGNLAELTSVLRQIVSGGKSAVVHADDLPLAIRSYPSTVVRAQPVAAVDLQEELRRVERTLIKAALAAFPRNRAAAARQLNLSRTKLLRRIEALGIDVPADDRPADPLTPAKIPQRPPAVRTEQPEEDLPVFEEIDEESV